MDIRTLLAKIFQLLYKCRQINSLDHDDLMRTILSTIKTDSNPLQQHFMSKNEVGRLRDYILELLEEKEELDFSNIMSTLAMILESDAKLLQTIKESIEGELEESSIKKSVTAIVKTLNNYYRETVATDIIKRMSMDIQFNRSKIRNFGDYLRGVINELEPFTTTLTSMKDPALVNEIDFEHPDSLNTVFEEVKNLNNNKSIYKTGWHALNRMTQGGIRRGEFVTIGALQHKYKTGLSLSMFMQIALHNTPIVTKEEAEQNKIPLLLRISFEDSLTNNLQFMYQYLKSTDGEVLKPKDLKYLDSSVMTDYILEKLTVNGFRIKMLRIDPNQWTYMHIVNKVLEYEAQGYSVHVLMLDYLTLVPTTGCIQGAIGADKRDLVRRMRNFCSARNITCITPLQLSSEAKQLTRNGIPDHQFVKEIAEKGYYDGVRSLDQEIDLELYLHLFSHDKKTYISVGRGKHRLPTTIGEEDKYFLLQFQGLNVPILEDINMEDTSLSKLPRGMAALDNNMINDLIGDSNE